jgi:sn-glycerol 3-phosphate transport system permease protein
VNAVQHPLEARAPVSAERARAQRAALLRLVLFYLGISLYALLLLLPLLTLVSVSFRADGDVFAPGVLPPNPTLEAYQTAFAKYPLARFLLNSALVSSFVTVGVLIVASTTGYALARVRAPWTRWLFGLIVVLLLMPGEVTFLPLFLLVNRLGWNDTFLALTVPFLASPLGIFLMRQFMLSLPGELFDAARMDGAGHLRQLWHVAVPLSLPALGALGSLTFLGTWNMYLWPLVVTNSKEMQTAQIAVSMILNDESTRWNVVAAGAIFVLLPTLVAFLVAQRAFVRGVAMGGLKG